MKMESAIRQMFFGNVGQKRLTKTTAEESELLKEVVRHETILREKLVDLPELLNLYDELSDSLDTLHSEELIEHYVEGFKFGLLVGLEIKYDDE